MFIEAQIASDKINILSFRKEDGEEEKEGGREEERGRGKETEGGRDRGREGGTLQTRHRKQCSPVTVIYEPSQLTAHVAVRPGGLEPDRA